jgi:hypothetical protein
MVDRLTNSPCLPTTPYDSADGAVDISTAPFHHQCHVFMRVADGADGSLPWATARPANGQGSFGDHLLRHSSSTIYPLGATRLEHRVKKGNQYRMARAEYHCKKSGINTRASRASQDDAGKAQSSPSACPAACKFSVLGMASSRFSADADVMALADGSTTHFIKLTMTHLHNHALDDPHHSPRMSDDTKKYILEECFPQGVRNPTAVLELVKARGRGRGPLPSAAAVALLRARWYQRQYGALRMSANTDRAEEFLDRYGTHRELLA